MPSVHSARVSCIEGIRDPLQRYSKVKAQFDAGSAGCVLIDLPAGQQERGDRVDETVWVLPEDQMAQLREDHELGAWDAPCEQLAVARVDHGVGSALQDQRACADARLP